MPVVSASLYYAYIASTLFMVGSFAGRATSPLSFSAQKPFTSPARHEPMASWITSLVAQGGFEPPAPENWLRIAELNSL